MRRDLLPADDLAALEEAMADIARALRRDRRRTVLSGVEEELTGKMETALRPVVRPRRMAGFRDNFEVLLVAVAVAMTFRAYFFQPFKIPTGSMQPTLYGIHSIDRESPGTWDRMPLKPLKWLASGSWHHRVVARADGHLRLIEHSRRPGFSTMVAAGHSYDIPADAVRHRRSVNFLPRNRRELEDGVRVRAGDLIWAGDVIAGDHVFVNRMRWNFVRPRRGDVMVFSTDGIADLQQGTHYIKRMAGMPGERLSIEPPDLVVDGLPVGDEPRIERIAGRRQLAPWAPPYRGFQLVAQVPGDLRYPHPLRSSGDSVLLGEDEYFALGDNTGDSLDSRYFGPVPGRNLVGPASCVYWPFLSPRWGRMR